MAVMNLNIQFAITGQGYSEHDAHDSNCFFYSMHFPLVEIQYCRSNKKLWQCNFCVNWTEWSTIRVVIARVISKSDERKA